MSLSVPRIPRFGAVHIVMAVAVLLLALFAYAAVQSAAQTLRLHERRDALTAEVAGLRRQRAELEGLRAYLASDEYVEGVARERFGLVRADEIAVVVEAPEPAAAPREAGERWWESLFDR